MRQKLDRFILAFPVLFLKQYPYAWIVAVTLWPRSAATALLFLLVVVAGMLSLRWRSAAWVSQMRFEHGAGGGRFYVDQPPRPWRQAAGKVALLVAGSILLAYLLRGQLGLTFWQYLFMIVGFVLLYEDTRFFGAAVTYIVTSTGIGIHFVPGHLDYRLYLLFKEISRIEQTKYSEDSDTDVFACTRAQQEGLLLVPKDARGFSKRINKLFIVPGDIEGFLEQLPYGYGKTSF